jgi:hypothetical protein
MRIYIDVLKLIEREDLYGRERPDPHSIVDSC